MSNVFQPRQKFTIALTEPVSGRALSGKEMIEALVLDLQARANNDFSQDEGFAAALARGLERIQRAGAHPSALVCSPQAALAPHRYSQVEVDEVLDSFKPGKTCLSLPYAALRSVVSEGSSPVLWSI
jgi:hypothetical protein